MPKTRSHYDNLEVSEDASQEVVQGAYRYLCQKWHPDKNLGNNDRAEARMKEINAAYELLSNPQKRAEYDGWLKAQRAGSGASPSSVHPVDAGAQAEDSGLRYHYANEIAKKAAP